MIATVQFPRNKAVSQDNFKASKCCVWKLLGTYSNFTWALTLRRVAHPFPRFKKVIMVPVINKNMLTNE